jgi:hypothetical protein
VTPTISSRANNYITDVISVTLSGIDPVLLNESMTDIQPGAPAALWFGLMSNTAAVLDRWLSTSWWNVTLSLMLLASR